MAVYLELFHGRKSVQEQLEDWGEQGPIVGPLKFVHTTYATHLKLQTSNGVEGDLRVVGPELPDLLYYDGAFYGDWSVFSPDSLQENWASRIQQYDPAKAIPPATNQTIAESGGTIQ
jgi:hypothetical protein